MQAFRTLVKSKFGGAIVLLFLVVLTAGFVLTDLRGLGVGGGGATGSVATVDGKAITAAELSQRVAREFENARAQDPSLDMARFVATGGVESALDRTIDGLVLERFASDQGLVVSRRMEDGQISSIPAFIGLDGKFSRANLDQFLQSSRMTEAQLRTDLSREVLANQLVLPISGASRAPSTLALPYASMLLEGRVGRVQFIPSSAIRAGSPPTDAELNQYYRTNVGRYTLPERRVVRYALIAKEAFQAAAKPTEAEIAKAYADARERYAARETRTLTQVILPTEAAAKSLAAKVSGGAPIAAAALAAGGEAVTLDPQSREAFAELSSPPVTSAAFTTPRGGIAPPAQSGLGWHVVQIDAIQVIAGRSLDQARGEIAAALAKTKADEAEANFTAKLEDDIAGGSTFDEVVASRRLPIVTTSPLLADGRDPVAPAAPVPPELALIAKGAFGMEPDDDPVLERIGADKFAVIDLERTVPAAARPLTAIRDQVARDFTADRAAAEARRIASAIMAKVNGGMPLAQAAASAGVPLPAPKQIGGLRQDVLSAGTQVPPQDRLLFSMTERRAKLLEVPNKAGWSVVHLERIDRGDASGRPDLVEATRGQFGQVLGQEYAEQFVAALRASVGVTRNGAAIAQLKRELLGTASTDQ